MSEVEKSIRTIRPAKPVDEMFPDLDGNVVDHEAYKIYKSLRRSAIFNKDRMYEFEDGDIVDLAMFPTYLKKLIEAQPLEEQQKCLAQKAIFNQKRGAILIYKRKSLGGKLMGVAAGSDHSMIATRKEEILELFGRMFTIEEVHKIIVEDWKIPCGFDVVQRFRKYNIDIISAKIEKYKVEYSDLRLGVKRSRLEEYIYIYSTLKDKFKTTSNREDAKVMTSTLEAIRKEVEGDRLTIDGSLDISIENTLNIHLQQEVFKSVNIQQVIVARIAAKIGKNATEVIRSLVSSYYAKYTGFKPASVEGTDQDEVIFPSTMSYDFDQIVRKNNSDVQEAKVIESRLFQERGVVALESKKMGLKEMLLAKINQRNIEVKDKQVSIEANRAIQEAREAKKKNLKKDNERRKKL